ncbi:homoserine kinase [Marchantia polymorpha subsp. ruderalis]|uniref:Homoserine kinase n=2 Tax=Marchantia polymorpha TaxID=3197 RepID=A0AAF6BP83_MARPO|nr:hypothetical protein MARPO_0173s0009 [Marchantia polymorpha]BBN13817.1 hypothetical protein Mp_6g06640 [Marchantia polymorpha subsp. ruderalis]|eukprot:PTQ28106.1 hypothetical protein MARPO_0173s0009 [Marchantia polymorpha]
MATTPAAMCACPSLANSRAFTKSSFLGHDVRATARVSAACIQVPRRSTSTSTSTATSESFSIRSERKSQRVKCRAVKTASPVPPLVQLTTEEPKPVLQYAKAFAPATVANLGPGYDFLGCAVEGMGDFVTAEVDENIPGGTVAIESITGDEGRLSLIPEKNCAGIAGQATLTLLGVRNVGVRLNLHKGLPLGSGLGSSAASAAAAAVAVNALFGSPLSKAQLVQAGLESEATVSGYHADNVAPSLMGGFVLVRSYDPLHLIPLEFPKGKQLYFVLVIPEFEAPTKEMRAVLSPEISMKSHVSNCSQAAALVSAILLGDARLLGSALGSDTIVEPKRGPLIPGMLAVKLVSMKHDAFGCTISGAGPTTVAITDSEDEGHRIGARMVEEFMADGKLKATAHVQKLDREGARVVDSRKL